MSQRETKIEKDNTDTLKLSQEYKSNARAFKFRSGTSKDMESLKEAYLWFSHLDELNDPFEGWASINDENITNSLRIKFLKKYYQEKKSLNHITEKKIQELYLNSLKSKESNFEEIVDEKAREILRNFFNDFREETHIHSLSLARDEDIFPFPLNSMMLWAHYANGFKGYCIEYDYDELMKSINSNSNTKRIVSSRIEYSKTGELPLISLKSVLTDIINDAKNTSLEILQAFRTKEQTWFYENEVRLISLEKGPKKFNTNCIKSVYLSEKMEPSMREKLINILKSFPEIPNIYDVVLHRTHYRLGFNKIN